VLARGSKPHRAKACRCRSPACSHLPGAGHGHNLSTTASRALAAPLAEAALFWPVTSRVPPMPTGSSALAVPGKQRSQARAKGPRDRLAAEVSTLAPSLIQNYIDWIAQGESGIEWRSGSRSARRCRSAGGGSRHRAQAPVSQSLRQVLSRQNDPTALIAFLHARLQKAPGQYRRRLCRRTVRHAAAQPWSAEYEDEAIRAAG